MRASGSPPPCAIGAGASRHVPQLGVIRVDGNRPGVVAVETVVGRAPSVARVLTECRPAATGFVRAPALGRVPRERVHVSLRAGPVST
jgi:hypothetical protein